MQPLPYFRRNQNYCNEPQLCDTCIVTYGLLPKLEDRVHCKQRDEDIRSERVD